MVHGQQSWQQAVAEWHPPYLHPLVAQIGTPVSAPPEAGLSCAAGAADLEVAHRGLMSWLSAPTVFPNDFSYMRLLD